LVTRGQRLNELNRRRDPSEQLVKFIRWGDLDKAVEYLDRILKQSDRPAQIEAHIFGELCQLLHHKIRIFDPRKHKDPRVHLDELVRIYRRRLALPQPRSTQHLLACYLRSGNLQQGATLWSWLVKQEDAAYVNLENYGLAIEIYARNGATLDQCEDIFQQAVARFPMSFNSYHLSPGAILADPSVYTSAPGTSLNLLAGTMAARFIRGDVKGAWLLFDTALRLHPTQMPPSFVANIAEQRPVSEVLQALGIVMRGGTPVSGALLAKTLEDARSMMLTKMSRTIKQQNPTNRDRRRVETKLECLQTFLSLVRLAHVTKTGIFPESFARCFVELVLDYLVAIHQEAPNGKTRRLEVETIAEIAALLRLLGTGIHVETCRQLILYGEILHNPDLIRLGATQLQNLTPSDEGSKSFETCRWLLRAYGNIKDAQGVQRAWKEHLGGEGDVLAFKHMPVPWAYLEHACKKAGCEEFFEAEKARVEEREQIKYPRIESLAESIFEDKGPPPSLAHSLSADEIGPWQRAPLEAIRELRILIESGLVMDLGKYPVTKLSIFPQREVPEQWTKRLYEELCIDPNIVASPQAQSAPSPKDAPTETSSSPPSTAPAANITLSPTSIPLGSLRQQNWAAMTSLLQQSMHFERLVSQRVDLALAAGKPVGQIRSLAGAKQGKRRRDLEETFSISEQETGVAMEDWLDISNDRRDILRRQMEAGIQMREEDIGRGAWWKRKQVEDGQDRSSVAEAGTESEDGFEGYHDWRKDVLEARRVR